MAMMVPAGLFTTIPAWYSHQMATVPPETSRSLI
jgi:hypothetical protein